MLGTNYVSDLSNLFEIMFIYTLVWEKDAVLVFIEIFWLGNFHEAYCPDGCCQQCVWWFGERNELEGLLRASQQIMNIIIGIVTIKKVEFLAFVGALLK